MNSRKEHVRRLIDNLQKEIDEREKRKYSEKAIREYRNPKNVGKISVYNGYGEIKGSCGDTVKFFLYVEDDIIGDISFMTDGCGATIACASALTQMVKGQRTTNAYEVSNEDVISYLDGLSNDNLHCAELVIRTLKKALDHYNEQN